MEKRILCTLVIALGTVLLSASNSQAIIGDPWIAGDFQTELGQAGDWNPALGILMTDPNSDGIYDVTLGPLTGAVAGSRFQYKILDDEGFPPPAWGDDELTPENGWFLTDATGSATISINTNTYSDGLLPATNRVAVSTDATQVTSFHATGSWMNEASGGAVGDWTNNSAAFQLVSMGGGLYKKDVTIATPGTYEYKVTKGDWDGQWGARGRSVNAQNIVFDVVAVNQNFSFLLDIAKGAVGFTTDTFTPGDTDGDTIVELEQDFGPIRDNWLKPTFLRSQGNLVNTGASTGVVDIADFREWKNAYNGTLSDIVAAWNSLQAVPEPGSVLLISLAGLMLSGTRRLRS
jgi:hypothetical protein